MKDEEEQTKQQELKEEEQQQEQQDEAEEAEEAAECKSTDPDADDLGPIAEWLDRHKDSITPVNSSGQDKPEES